MKFTITNRSSHKVVCSGETDSVENAIKLAGGKITAADLEAKDGKYKLAWLWDKESWERMHPGESWEAWRSHD
jgi:hypothetical protein